MLSRHFWANLKGLSCALLLLFGIFFLLILSVLAGLYTLYLSSLWPYLLILSITLIAFLSWVQLDALHSDHEVEAERRSSRNTSSIPTITGLLTTRGSPITYNPPPPYCEASLYQEYKPSASAGDGCSTEAANNPPPSYDEAIAIKLAEMAEVAVPPNCFPTDNTHNKNTQSSRTRDLEGIV